MKRPPWAKRRVSCPDCGHIYVDEDGDHLPSERHIVRGSVKVPGTYNLREKNVGISVKCPQCSVVLSWEEFWDANHSKYDTSMEEET